MVNHALTNNRIRTLTNASLGKKELNVGKTRRLTVQQILRFAVTIEPARDGYFRVIDLQRLILVIKHERHLGKTRTTATLRS